MKDLSAMENLIRRGEKYAWEKAPGQEFDQFLTVRKVATLLSVSERTVRRLIASGELRAYRLHRMVRIKSSDLAKVLERW